MNIGFIGTGALSTAVVHGLCKSGSSELMIHVSPRSEKNSSKLSADYTCVNVADSNQTVVDQSEVVFISTLPHQARGIVNELEFKSHHTIVSFVAGLECAEIHQLAQPAIKIHRMLALPPVKICKGPVVLYPYHDKVAPLLAPLGRLIIPTKESDFSSMLIAGGLMSSYVQMSNEAINWLESEGVAKHISRDYMLSLFSSLGELGMEISSSQIDSLAGSLETPSGLNERCRQLLNDGGWFSRYYSAIDDLKEYVTSLK